MKKNEKKLQLGLIKIARLTRTQEDNLYNDTLTRVTLIETCGVCPTVLEPATMVRP